MFIIKFMLRMGLSSFLDNLAQLAMLILITEYSYTKAKGK